MSNNKNTYIVLPSGKECKLKNPFPIEDLKDGFYVANFDHLEFEANNPTYALTEVMPEGEFVGEIQHQEIDNLGVFWDISKDSYDLLNDGFRRIAIKPLKVKEPAKDNLVTCTILDKHDKVASLNRHKSIVYGPGNDNYGRDKKPYAPPVDVVENKETVEDAIYTCNGCGGKLRYDQIAHTNDVIGDDYCKDCTSAIIDDLQISNGAEAIDFTINWILKEGYVNHASDRKLLLSKKSKIIKEYNNGK